MDSEIKPEPAKFKSMKHYALGAGGLAAAIAILMPVKDFFYTRDEAVAQVQRIDKLESSQDHLRDELVSAVEKNTDRILLNLDQRDVRTNVRMDNLEKNLNNRIDLLMQKELIDNQRRNK